MPLNVKGIVGGGMKGEKSLCLKSGPSADPLEVCESLRPLGLAPGRPEHSRRAPYSSDDHQFRANRRLGASGLCPIVVNGCWRLPEPLKLPTVKALARSRAQFARSDPIR